MAEFTNELYPAILSFLGTSGSQEVTDPELIRVLSKEINKLIRDRGDFVKNRDKNGCSIVAKGRWVIDVCCEYIFKAINVCKIELFAGADKGLRHDVLRPNLEVRM